MTTPLEIDSQKGRNLMELLLTDKSIVPDPYYVPDNTPYYHEANSYGSVLIICNPTDDHFKHFDTSDYVSVDVTNWCDMEDGLNHYASWEIFSEWIVGAMSHARYMTKQAVEALCDIIRYMEKV